VAAASAAATAAAATMSSASSASSDPAAASRAIQTGLQNILDASYKSFLFLKGRQIQVRFTASFFFFA
jgi:hypothetical protein